ncbi:uncharacterized protein CC84DRAFT_869830 [Paraphaeosphaeria sporulosa]|uniref:Uncharacterized protein n=1 Tax=Paraphaeosphaeria sporulosa TaxID=1460663 RepID=A0A177CAS3_9PLEO|nr:uncharacterized protein CC84DRAFT_869830 [Paraphaeosphaeria sporulosa]OAG03857.1 hypothetical protein CC84DRAFT_869830 [Paraphaeosphaeria sporulosa]
MSGMSENLLEPCPQLSSSIGWPRQLSPQPRNVRDKALVDWYSLHNDCVYISVAIQCAEHHNAVPHFPPQYIAPVLAPDLHSDRNNSNYYKHLNTETTSEMTPRSAALTGLYFNSHSNSRGPRSSHFYMLSDQDMPLLARILEGSAVQEVQERIQSLPRHLRASGFHKAPSSATGKVQPGYLCDLHKKLKKGLCYELMSLIQHEIFRIGSFVYSVIMSGELDAWEEMRVRQLEPVPQMYVPGFTPREGAPVGHEPLVPGFVDQKGIFVPVWAYEPSQCPACMLSRIGADSKVLFALLAGTVARMGRRARGHRTNLKSRRVRFLKEWLEACVHGQRLRDDAFDLGGRMRDIKRQQRRRAHEKRVLVERAREMQAREAYDIRVGMSDHRGMNSSHRPVSRTAAVTTGYRKSIVNMDISEPYSPQRRHRGANGWDRPVSHTSADATGPRECVVGVDISESYAPQYQQASSHPIHNVNPPTDQTPAIGVDAFRPGSWRLRNNIPSSKEKAISGEDARGADRSSAGTVPVGVDILEPLIPAPRPPSNYMPPHCEPDVDERALPATIQSMTSPAVDTLVRDRSRRSGIVFASSTSYERYPSIASSFASNVSLNDLRAPSANPNLVPSPLRIPSRRLPPFPERSPARVLQPHPLSIYGTVSGSGTATAGRYADVSPPSTPNSESTGHAQSQYDVSLPSSPELDGFDTFPPGTPVMHSRPVTPWSGLYGS